MEMTGGVTRPNSKPNAATTTMSWVDEPMHEAVLNRFVTKPMMRCLDAEVFGKKSLSTEGQHM
jgi:hypothetical protein